MPKFFTWGKRITSIPDLLKNVQDFVGDSPIENVYLRGQANYKWPLLPTIGRKLDYFGLTTNGYDRELEGRLLHQFRRYARAFPGGNVDGREILLLAAHHGVPVRLLDWTSNPLVALYFACVERDDRNRRKSGAIWMILRKTHRREDYYDIYKRNATEILRLKGVKIIYAPYVSPRIMAQSGHFTTQDNPAKDLEKYRPPRDPKNAKTFDIMKIEKWKVPAGKKLHFISELQRCGINERALFPDLDGIARSIVRTEVLRSQAGGKNRR